MVDVDLDVDHWGTSEEVSPEEMEAMLRAMIWRAHRMTKEEYYAAKAAGTLKRKLVDSAIEVFTGECLLGLHSCGEE